MPHTPVPPGAESGTTGAGSPRQLAPRSSVRTIDVHTAFEQGAVPRTKASCVETNVTDVAVKPLGTGPPGGAGVIGCPGVTDGAVGGAWLDGAVGACDDAQPDSAKPVSSTPERTVKPLLAQDT